MSIEINPDPFFVNSVFNFAELYEPDFQSYMYMYMFHERDGIHWVYAFKNRETRKYVKIRTLITPQALARYFNNCIYGRCGYFDL